MEKFCQSCGKPLTVSHQGTEQSGELSKTYCDLCYQNGEWTEPTLTFEQMLAKGITGIQADQTIGKFKQWLLVKSYPMLLKKMRRWQATANH